MPEKKDVVGPVFLRKVVREINIEKGSTFEEVFKLQGSEELKSLLKEFYILSELSEQTHEKLNKLQKLSEKINDALKNKEADEIIDPSGDSARIKSDYYARLSQMVEGEIKTLKIRLPKKNEEPKEKTEASSTNKGAERIEIGKQLAATSSDQERRERKEKRPTVDLEWLRDQLKTAESSFKYLLDAHTRPSYVLIKEEIEKSFKNEEDPTRLELKKKLLDELNARVALNDVAMNFENAKHYPDKRENGRGYISGRNLEVIFHEMENIKELVPIALGMYEMALRGLLPPFGKDCNAASWGTYKNQVQEEISSRLNGKSNTGDTAAYMADRLVLMSNMIPYYEEAFLYTRKMVDRDNMRLEEQRKSYGAAKRIEGAGTRAHGPDATVGKYWGKPGSNINPIFTVNPNPGEPYWDMYSDFWNYAPVLTRDNKNIYEGGRLVTYASHNRIDAGKQPNFDLVKNLLSEEQIGYLRGLPWQGTVDYTEMHFTKDHPFQGRAETQLKDESMTEYIEQTIARDKLRVLLLQTEWDARKFSTEWFEDNKTTFDYLASTGNVIRDVGFDSVKRDAYLRGVQTDFLLGVLIDHSPVTSPRKDWWEVGDILLILARAASTGFITQKQMEFIEGQLGLNKVIGAVRRADITEINRKAIEAIQKLK